MAKVLQWWWGVAGQSWARASVTASAS